MTGSYLRDVVGGMLDAQQELAVLNRRRISLNWSPEQARYWRRLQSRMLERCGNILARTHAANDDHRPAA